MQHETATNRDSHHKARMTQILGYQAADGILLATDSRAVHYRDDGTTVHLTVSKVFRLRPHVVLITGGAGYALPLCRAFIHHVERAGLFDREDIFARALPFFRTQYGALREEPHTPPFRPDLDRFYLLLAGHTLRSDAEPFRMILLGSEASQEPLHAIPVSRVLAIPRQMGFEFRLNRGASTHAGLNEVEGHMEGLLERLSRSGDDVAPPFHFVRITKDGITMRTTTAHPT